MVGNMWEWTTTKFGASQGSASDDPSTTSYVLRGGSYIDTKDGKSNHQLRVTTRYDTIIDRNRGRPGAEWYNLGWYQLYITWGFLH